MKKILTALLFLIQLTTTAQPVLNPKTRWKFQTQGPIRGSSVLDEKKVYFGSSDGFVYAVDKTNGDLAWKFQTQGTIASSPALLAGLVLVSSRDNFVYALNVATGQLTWKFQMQPVLPSYWEWDYFTAAPVVVGDKVYVGSGDGNLYVISAVNGKLLWKFKTNGRVRASPLVAGETIYLPSNDGMIYTLSAKDGKLLWQFETAGAKLDSRKFGWDRNSIYTQPVLQDSLLVFGSRDGNAYCVNVNTRKEKWRFSYGATWCMSVQVENNIAFAGWSDNSTICAIDILIGKEKWKYTAGSLVYTKAFVHGGEVIFGSADYKVYCLDKNTGDKKWEYKLDGSVHSSPVVDSGIVYVGSDDGSFRAIGEGPKPFRMVYQPVVKDRMKDRVFTVDKKITPYLKERGFQQLDSATLYQFVSERIRDQAPSVIVFGYDLIPANIVGAEPEKGLIRKYLDAGGKIIWSGNIPNLYTITEKGFVADKSVAERMLGVEYERQEESGNYFCKSTQAGLNMGLPAWLTVTYANIKGDGVTPLAVDENQRVSVWTKKFNSRPGSGFISCRPWGWYEPIQDHDLELIYKLAVHELE